VSDYKLFQCVQCGFEYDEAKGWPEEASSPATRWMTPEDWSCRTRCGQVGLRNGGGCSP